MLSMFAIWQPYIMFMHNCVYTMHSTMYRTHYISYAIVTLCTYAQQGYAFGRVRMYVAHLKFFLQISGNVGMTHW